MECYLLKTSLTTCHAVSPVLSPVLTSDSPLVSTCQVVQGGVGAVSLPCQTLRWKKGLGSGATGEQGGGQG